MRQIVIFIAATSGLAASIACGQVVIEGTALDAEGAIVGSALGKLQLVISDKPWIVHIDAKKWGDQGKTSVELQAQANPELLRTNPVVRFTAHLDDKGRPTEPLKEITLFTPLPETQAGFFPHGVEAVGDDEPARDGGVAPNQSKDAPRRPNAEQLRGETQLPGKVFVVGQVTRFHKNELTVQVLRQRLTLELADDAQVNVHITDKQLFFKTLQLGDRVNVKGFYVEAGEAYAQRLVANLPRRLGGEREKPQSQPPVAAIKPNIGAEEGVVDPKAEFGVGDAPADVEKPKRVEVLKIN